MYRFYAYNLEYAGTMNATCTDVIEPVDGPYRFLVRDSDLPIVCLYSLLGIDGSPSFVRA